MTALALTLLFIFFFALIAVTATAQATVASHPTQAQAAVQSLNRVQTLNPGAISLELFADQFQFPVFAIAPPDGSGRFFVVERSGQIRVYDGANWLATPFLNISDRVATDQECGLLSMAFPPDFGPENQSFYVYYSANTDRIPPPAGSAEPNNGCDSVVSRFSVTDNPNVADPASEETILLINQPYSNHNGGQIAFGPDGALYIGTGDGGSAGDPLNAGQRTRTLLGKMLRIRVGTTPTYTIPADNPFAEDATAEDATVAQADARPEIWARGLRNPYRFSFDRATGDLFIADVGQNSWEEVNFQPASSTGGENYGWAEVEGPECYRAQDCPIENYTAPVYTYPHRNEGCAGSVTGGYVYRGDEAALQGIYFFGDYCTRELRGLWQSNSAESESAPLENAPLKSTPVESAQGSTDWSGEVLLETAVRITGFGEDDAGNLYLLGIEGDGASRRGVIYRIQAATPTSEPRLFIPRVMRNAQP